jgi:hypothetical protein
MNVSIFFLICAIVEFVAGVALLAVYNNPLGYLGLIASGILMGFCFVVKSIKG